MAGPYIANDKTEIVIASPCCPTLGHLCYDVRDGAKTYRVERCTEGTPNMHCQVCNARRGGPACSHVWMALDFLGITPFKGMNTKDDAVFAPKVPVAYAPSTTSTRALLAAKKAAKKAAAQGEEKPAAAQAAEAPAATATPKPAKDAAQPAKDAAQPAAVTPYAWYAITSGPFLGGKVQFNKAGAVQYTRGKGAASLKGQAAAAVGIANLTLAAAE